MSESIQLQVWPEFAPDETSANTGMLRESADDIERVSEVTSPQLFIYPAHRANAPTILVCPGGGYEILAVNLEGTEVALWLQSLGFGSAVLHYRVPDNRKGALQDGQRALSLLRSRASEFGFNSDCIGVMGFSAGGHLCAQLAVAGSHRTYQALDAIDQSPCHPDFAMLIYPAFLIDFAGGVPNPDVTPVAGMPPIFMAQSVDDCHFCTPAYAEALGKVSVPVQSKVYESGGHGYGVRLASEIPASHWTADAANWLKQFSE